MTVGSSSRKTVRGVRAVDSRLVIGLVLDELPAAHDLQPPTYGFERPQNLSVECPDGGPGTWVLADPQHSGGR
ncbi:hypothetical protein GW7_12977 [Heterocephalus glaber]|uniref:Uncharacterized protein n=1 Tax=Heterocephalus glaber TaxID=10181 RepID=G5BXW0_HETGA|nr:hypothetical protein GW7_12977 [Heterocephalus glaber]